MIIVVLSDRYLESDFCMYELNGIWTRACHDENLFLARVIPLILPDAKLKTTQDFLTRGEYWLSQKRDLDDRIGQNLDSVGPLLYERYKLIKQFAEHATDMLLLLLDKHEPRDFERQAQEGFQEVAAQILAAKLG
jgi:internalin A